MGTYLTPDLAGSSVKGGAGPKELMAGSYKVRGGGGIRSDFSRDGVPRLSVRGLGRFEVKGEAATEFKYDRGFRDAFRDTISALRGGNVNRINAAQNSLRGIVMNKSQAINHEVNNFFRSVHTATTQSRDQLRATGRRFAGADRESVRGLVSYARSLGELNRLGVPTKEARNGAMAVARLTREHARLTGERKEIKYGQLQKARASLNNSHNRVRAMLRAQSNLRQRQRHRINFLAGGLTGKTVTNPHNRREFRSIAQIREKRTRSNRERRLSDEARRQGIAGS